MSRNGGCGISSLDKGKIEEGIRCEFGRSTANSRAKRVPRIPDQKRWYEREEIAQQYMYCVKDPPCQTCCRYNDRLFKTILETKRPFPPYKHKVTDFAHSRPRIYCGRWDEGSRKSDINSSLLYHGLQGSDVTALKRSVPPAHPNHPDAINAPSPWFGREPCDVTKASEAAARCPRPPSRDYFCGVEATDITVTTRRISPAGAPKDEAERGREFYGRPRTDVTNFSTFPEGISHYDKHPIGKPVPDACRGFVSSARDSTGRLLRARLNLPALPESSQPPPPEKGSSNSSGKGNWKEEEDKAFLCQQSPSSEVSTDRNQASADEPKLRTVSSDGTPSSLPKMTNTSLYSLSRLSEASSCADSPRLLKRPVLSPCDERTLLARDSSGKLLEPPPVRNAFSAKPPRPPTRALSNSAIQTAAPDAGRPGGLGRESLLGGKVICRHPPSKPCSLSCFGPSQSSSRTRVVDNSSSKTCASKLPDIFARRSKFSPRCSKRKSRCGTPLWKAGPPKSSTFFLPSAHCRSTMCRRYSYPRVHEETYDKARWKSAMDRDGFYCGLANSQKRMPGKADWKQMVSREIIAGR